ncbi:MAG TPA: homoserine kinase [Gemmatimonadales bacterium]|nr:homoserine kinase [Gemmatimonadales bacterium]
MNATVSVRVPGSSANLGAGFDCVGVAVNRWFSVTVRRDPAMHAAVRITRGGALAALDTPPDQDLLYTGFHRACAAAGCEPPGGLVMEASSEIPVARGLGSSAAAVVAGAVAARAFCNLPLDDTALTAVCAGVEGHADNVAPSIHGGATLVIAPPEAPGRWVVTPLDLHASLALVFAIPDFMVATEQARGVLPKTLEYHTAVVAAARSAALVQGLARGDGALLHAGLEDVLHVPYRRALITGYDQVTGAAVRAGAFGATLSGSGSTLVAVAPAAQAGAVETAMARAWQAIGVTVETFRMTRPAGRYQVA